MPIFCTTCTIDTERSGSCSCLHRFDRNTTICRLTMPSSSLHFECMSYATTKPHISTYPWYSSPPRFHHSIQTTPSRTSQLINKPMSTNSYQIFHQTGSGTESFKLHQNENDHNGGLHLPRAEGSHAHSALPNFSSTPYHSTLNSDDPSQPGSRPHITITFDFCECDTLHLTVPYLTSVAQKGASWLKSTHTYLEKVIRKPIWTFPLRVHPIITLPWPPMQQTDRTYQPYNRRPNIPTFYCVQQKSPGILLL